MDMHVLQGWPKPSLALGAWSAGRI